MIKLFIFMTVITSWSTMAAEALMAYLTPGSPGVYKLMAITQEAEVKEIARFSAAIPKIKVIGSFIYLHDQSAHLTVLNIKGEKILEIDNILKYVANDIGIVILDKEKNALIYKIHQTENAWSAQYISTETGITAAKWNHSILLLYGVDGIKIHQMSQQGTMIAQNTYGWIGQKNIAAAAFNQHFFLTKNSQGKVKAINAQGNILYEGRGDLKGIFLTKEYFILYYGNEEIEVYNAYDRQSLLSLPRISKIQTAVQFISFQWDERVTILNNKGEIFHLQKNSETKLELGDHFFALKENDVITTYDDSGTVQKRINTPSSSTMSFVGDYLCIHSKNDQTECSKINSAQIIQFYSNTYQLMSWSNVALVMWNKSEQNLRVETTSEQSLNITNVTELYMPISLEEKDVRLDNLL